MKKLIASASILRLEFTSGKSVKTKNRRELVGALIGFGYISQKFHLDSMLEDERVFLKYICDLDRDRLDSAKLKLNKLGKNKGVQFTTDYTNIVQDKEVDFVLIAIPHHWHAKMALEFINAKKHIYLEKPGCLTFEEYSKLLIEYENSNLCIQIGTQNRSNRSHIEGVAEFQSGTMGKARSGLALTYLSKGDRVSKSSKINNIPPRIDLPKWFGPAPIKNSGRKYFHEDWASFWDYSMGVAERTVHRLDLIDWAMNFKNISEQVTTIATRVRKSPIDCGETPNLQFSFHKNGDFSYSNEFHIWRDDEKFNLRKGIVLTTDKGHFCMTNLSRSFFMSNSGKVEKVFGPKKIRHNHVSHFRNFISSILEAKRDKLNSGLDKSLRASGSSILENLSLLEGRQVDKTSFAKEISRLGSSVSHEYLKRTMSLSAKLDPLIVGNKVTYKGPSSLKSRIESKTYPAAKHYPKGYPLVKA